MKIGYGRISSRTQDLDLQIQELLNFGCEKIFSESISAKTNDRPQLIAMIDILREGDLVVITKIDRLARSLRGLLEVVALLDKKKVNLRSLDCHNQVDTTTPMGRAFFQMAGVFAELERDMIEARTKAGLIDAKARGVKFGNKTGTIFPRTLEKMERIEIFLKAGKKYAWISKELKVGARVIANVKKGLAEKGAVKFIV